MGWPSIDKRAVRVEYARRWSQRTLAVRFERVLRFYAWLAAPLRRREACITAGVFVTDTTYVLFGARLRVNDVAQETIILV